MPVAASRVKKASIHSTALHVRPNVLRMGILIFRTTGLVVLNAVLGASEDTTPSQPRQNAGNVGLVDTHGVKEVAYVKSVQQASGQGRVPLPAQPATMAR